MAVVRVAVGSIALLAALAAPHAWAQAPPGAEEPLVQPPGAAGVVQPAPPPDGGAPLVPPPEVDDQEPPGASPVPPSPLETPTRTAPVDAERWPLEYVRRPQTLPAGMAALGATVGARRPDAPLMVDPTTGQIYAFHRYVAAGASLGIGVTDLAEVDLALPRILCFDGGAQPSGCDRANRDSGSGFGATIGVVRAPRVQLAIETGVSIASSSPTIFRWSLAVSSKLLAARWLALRARFAIDQYADPPPNIPNPVIGTLTIAADVQATRNLLLYAHVVPWGSLGDLAEGIELEIYGGASFTFTRWVQLALEGGKYNVLSLPRWSRFVPESFAALSVVFWSN